MRGETSLGRGIATIVVAGALLGLAHNGAGLLSRPSRGIPWVASRSVLPDLDSLSARGAGPAPVDPGNSAAPTPAAPASSTQAEPTTPRVSSRPTPTRPAPAPDRAAAATPQSPAPARPAVPPPFVPESDQPVQVKLATAKLLFDAGAALFLDAREPSDFEAGHIPGAMQMTREDALDNPDRVRALPVRGRPIVTYCDGGPCESSLELARALVGSGYRKVLVLSGGYPEWVAAGHPVERGGSAP